MHTPPPQYPYFLRMCASDALQGPALSVTAKTIFPMLEQSGVARTVNGVRKINAVVVIDNVYSAGVFTYFQSAFLQPDAYGLYTYEFDVVVNVLAAGSANWSTLLAPLAASQTNVLLVCATSVLLPPLTAAILQAVNYRNMFWIGPDTLSAVSLNITGVGTSGAVPNSPALNEVTSRCPDAVYL